MEVLTTLLSLTGLVLLIMALVCARDPNAARYVSCVLQARAAAKEAADAIYARKYHDVLTRQVKTLKVEPVFGIDPLPLSVRPPHAKGHPAHSSAQATSNLSMTLHGPSGGMSNIC